MGGSNERGSCKAMVRNKMDLRGKDVQETSPFESFLFWLKSWAGPFCCEGKTCEAYGQSLSGSILAKESTVACPLRAQGRGYVTGQANSPHCRAKIHVWSKAGISYFYRSFPHQAFQTCVCLSSGTG